jgi:hypothetical protein
MIGVHSDFHERVLEINEYFNFVLKVEKGDTELKQRTLNTPAYSYNERENLLRTFKASAFLLLYNLMESTVTNVVEAIFDELTRKNISFDACRNEIRRVVLANLKECDIDNIIPNLNFLAIDVITKTFRKEKIVSGNVDARKIKDIAKKYGFVPPAADGGDLLTVKSNRNDLAHGSKSFAEVGRDYTMEEIINIKNKVIDYLSILVNNVTFYINQQNYFSVT